jgi:hypothetical protein
MSEAPPNEISVPSRAHEAYPSIILVSSVVYWSSLAKYFEFPKEATD